MIKIKKAGIIALGCGILTVGVTTGISLSLPREEITLSIEGNKISWIDKSSSNLLDSFYHIYNDEFLVNKITERSYLLNEEKLIDEIGPNKIKKVNIVYNGDTVDFEWDDVEDLGTDNNLKIGLYDKNDSLKAFSNVIKKNYSSGVAKYIVEFKGDEYEVWDNKFSIKISDLKDGITTVKLYGIDNRGNKGAISSIPFYNYKIILSKEHDYLRFNIDDVTQKYLYKAIINGKDAGEIFNNEDLNAFIVDNKSPKAPKDIKIISSDKITNMAWAESVDIGNSYNVKVIGSGLNYYNNVSSDEVSIEKKSGVKGYYYSINKEKNYVVTNRDTFTNKCDVDHMGEYGSYYFHIAAVDNDGNISKTNTYRFEKRDSSLNVDNSGTNSSNNSNSNSNGSGNSNNGNGNNIQITPPSNTVTEEIESALDKKVKSIIKKVGNVTDYSFNKSVSILKLLPENTIDYMSSREIYVYITTGEAETLYKTFTGKESEDSITGAFVWGGYTTAVICETAYMDSTLLHELGHAFDYISGNGVLISSSNEFKNIYSEEKDSLFPSDEYANSSENEYFSESFSMYYKDYRQLKNNAPKTYEFLKRYLN